MTHVAAVAGSNQLLQMHPHLDCPGSHIQTSLQHVLLSPWLVQKDCTTLCCAVYYTRYLPSGCEPPREAAQTCFLWISTLLKLLAHQHETLVEQNRQALAKHKEHNKLVKLAANMSQDDYEHAGVEKA